MHRKVDGGESEARENRFTTRGMSLYHRGLGLTGRADVVEFRRADIDAKYAVSLPSRTGSWVVRPVEYKRGRLKEHDADNVQLCAQALCLEEMFGTHINSGEIFYGQTRSREPVEFDEGLRTKTIRLVKEVRSLLVSGDTPVVAYESKCESCSFVELCRPSFCKETPLNYLSGIVREELDE